MKPVAFCGRSLEAMKKFPDSARREAGHQLDRVQRGLEPLDWKAMTAIGSGVREIRIRSNGQYRVIYIVARRSTIFVLHAFRKKSQKMKKQDIEVAQQALRQIGK